MLDIEFILENQELVSETIKNKKGVPVDFSHLQKLHSRRNSLLKQVGDVNHKRKEAASVRDTEAGKQLKEEGAKLSAQLNEVTQELQQIISKIPNTYLADVPVGDDEDDNVVLREWGEKTTFSFTPKPHWELGKDLDIIDSERATKVSGSRFVYLKGDLVRVQFALIQWVLDVVTDKSIIEKLVNEKDLNISTKPYIPVVPPTLITPEMFFGMARLEPRTERYYIPDDNLFLIGSAEHTLGAMHANEMFNESELPIRYIGYSTSFRREAGSYGKDTKGILRQHQFDKLEFESFSVPEKSREEQDLLVALQEYLMQQLLLPYRVMAVCTGDMGGPDLRQIDIEVWMPGQGKYRETHSADLMGEYQARRLGTKVRRDSGINEFVHMNDATAIAIGRTLIALLENNQQSDGSITVPNVLRPYMNGIDKISK